MKRKINIITHFVNSLLFIVMGLIFIIKRNEMFAITIKVIGVLLLITVVFKVINVLVKRRKILDGVLDILITLITSIFIIESPSFFVSFFIIVFGIYAMLQSLSSLINLYIYKHDHLHGKLGIVFKFFISFVTSYLLLFSRVSNSKYLCLITGIYLIIYGVNIFAGIFERKKRLVIPLPTILTMFIPPLLIKKVEKEKGNISTNVKKDINPNLEILIHLAKNGSAMMGHVEVAVCDKIYSYSCYNYTNRRLWGGMGDGILGIFDHDKYIKYCVCEKNRFIVSYGVLLTEKEIDIVLNKITEMLQENAVRWYPEYALYDMNLSPKKEFTEMANQTYKKADGIFYKFIKGKFKTFFVCRTNCVEVADTILASLGTKVINLEGVLSPGTYYSYLEKEYLKKNSRIVSKTVYTKEFFKKKKY